MFQTTSEQVSGSLDLIMIFIVFFFFFFLSLDDVFVTVMNDLLEEHEDRLAKAHELDVSNLAMPSQVFH